MTCEMQSEASARPARGGVEQRAALPLQTPSLLSLTSMKRPPRGGAGRALAAGGGRVLRASGVTCSEVRHA